MYIMSLDPGNYIGYAIWKSSHFKDKTLSYPMYYGTIQHKNEKVRLLKFKNLISQFPITSVYMENSALMKNSAKGRVSAESGALVKLSQTIGRLIQICEDNKSEVILISVAKWKGSLPKHICEKRVRRILPDLAENAKSSHAIDAIGIGLYVAGFFK